MKTTTSPTIWYCHPTAGSPNEGMSYRPYYLCKYWRLAGANAYIISSSFHHLLQHHQPQTTAVHLQLIDNIPYIRLKTPHYQHNNLRRILNMFSYSSRFVLNRRQILNISGKPDVIIVSSSHPFHYFPLYWYAKAHHIPLIFEVRDLWPSSLIELLQLPNNHPLITLLAYIERHAYRHADQIVSLLEFAKPYMLAQGLSEHKFHYIPNGTETDLQSTEAIALSPEHQQCLTQLKRQGHMILAYTGAMGPPNALQYLLQAFKILQEQHAPVHAVLVGKGQELDALQTYAHINQLHNVHFLPPIPKPMVIPFLKQVDVAYLGWNPTPLYQYGVSPNKIFDYMQAATPIIESGGAPISMVTQAQCGLHCQTANPNDIAHTIQQFSLLPAAERQTIGQYGKHYVQQHHSYDILAQKYLKLIKKHDL